MMLVTAAVMPFAPEEVRSGLTQLAAAARTGTTGDGEVRGIPVATVARTGERGAQAL